MKTNDNYKIFKVVHQNILTCSHKKKGEYADILNRLANGIILLSSTYGILSKSLVEILSNIDNEVSRNKAVVYLTNYIKSIDEIKNTNPQMFDLLYDSYKVEVASSLNTDDSLIIIISLREIVDSMNKAFRQIRTMCIDPSIKNWKSIYPVIEGNMNLIMYETNVLINGIYDSYICDGIDFRPIMPDYARIKSYKDIVYEMDKNMKYIEEAYSMIISLMNNVYCSVNISDPLNGVPYTVSNESGAKIDDF